MVFNCGLRVCWSQRGSDGLRRLRRPRAGRTPRSARQTVGTGCRALAVVHSAVPHRVVLLPVVMATVATVAGDLEAGEENGRDDKNDAGDNHNPRRESVEPVRFDYLSR